jgi:pimeloyl-ACP methyl ester carboxylesterase
MLIQGMGVGANGWLPQVDALMSHYQCVSFDNRGYGLSQPTAKELTLDMMADDVLALMDAQGWQSAHLVGHSIGGLIALYAAHRARERVRSLCLLCTFASGKTPTRAAWALVRIGIRTRIGTRRMRRHAFLELVVPSTELANADRDAVADRLAQSFGRDLADQPPVIMQQFRATRAADATPFLDGLAGVPTLVVSAEHDVVAPQAAGRGLANGIAGARFVCVPDASHGVTLQNPAVINELLIEHLGAAEALVRQPRDVR